MGARFTGVSYFSGGGLADFGLSDIVEHVGAVEYSPEIAAHYSLVFPGADLRVQDVCTVDPSSWAGIDYFHASPSCVRASVANSDRGETAEDIASAAAVCRGIRVMRPKVFTLENVSAYQTFQAFRDVCDCLTECGYRWDARVFNSADFGVAQTRKRLYIRAWLRPEPIPHLAPTHQSREKMAIASSVGDMFIREPMLPWVGWHEALTAPRYGIDLIPTLPDSTFAKWQLARLKKDQRFAAFFTGTEPPQPYLCGVQGEGGDLARGSAHPAPALTATHGAGKYRAFIVDGQATIREINEPAFTIKTAGGGRVHRASMQARVVSMTPWALARFQMGVYADRYPLPDRRSLTCKIIGNGVATEAHRAIVLPLLEDFK